MNLWRFCLSPGKEDVYAYVFALEPLGASITWGVEPSFLIEGYIQEKTEPYTSQSLTKAIMHLLSCHSLDVKKLEVEPYEDRNWILENQRQFPPIKIGSFLIESPYSDVKSLEGCKYHLKILAALAFGSGEHETTKGCLLAIERIKNEGFNPKNILDMGCGSGILAIAASKVWDSAQVLAVDFDPLAVRSTQENASLNNVSLSSMQSDGFSGVEGSFDLILANILAGPLVQMASDMRSCLKQGGYVILSGLLENQSSDVLKAYQKEGFSRIAHFCVHNWSTLILC